MSDSSTEGAAGKAAPAGRAQEPLVVRQGDAFVVDASLLGGAFGLTVEQVRAAMARGEITCHCEAGIDVDAGRWRLTFRRGALAFRMIVTGEGRILARGTRRLGFSPKP